MRVGDAADALRYGVAADEEVSTVSGAAVINEEEDDEDDKSICAGNAAMPIDTWRLNAGMAVDTCRLIGGG